MGRTPGILLVAADAVGVVALRPDAAFIGHLRAPRAWVSAAPDAAVTQLAAAALWCVSLWVAVGLLATALGQLPGGLGRLGERVAARTLPAAVRRVVAGSAGLGVLLAPVAALADTHHRTAHVAGPRSTAVEQLPGPAWPSGPGRPTPGPRWPSSTPAPTPPGSTPDTGPDSTPGTTRQDTRPRRADTAAADVTVRAGDSLWLLAARRLGPGATDAQIAGYWPRLHHANRGVVGADPDLIRPGQVLHVPAPTPQEMP